MPTLKQIREQKNLTQTELAEKSKLSLRTIQRIEAGNTPKGFTLKTLADTLEIEPEKLIFPTETTSTDRAKLINLSVLLGLIIPYGGIIFPLILTSKTDDTLNKELGKNIVSVQILLAVLLSVLLIISPFLQKYFTLGFPLFMVPLIFFLCLKVVIVVLNGMSLNQKNDLPKNLKINYL
ncbi:MAG: helix-turn-helix domain-containing protein [Flavobacterium sp.]|nr:MAG: helix-turn-helix domain-containing protein [Flavobacterium sp.]